MLVKRIAQAAFLAVVVGAVGLGLAWTAHALSWEKVTVDATGDVGGSSSIAVNTNLDPVIAYYDSTNTDLKFAICDWSATGCDATGEWTKVTVDQTADNVGGFASLAVKADGDPMISYIDTTHFALKFAICDLATGCDAPGEWTKYTVDDTNVGWFTSIAVNADGDPMISYFDYVSANLMFAICDLATGCDAPGDWTKDITVDDAANSVGAPSSIAVKADGDPMIAYYDSTAGNLKFAICDLATGCDATGEWTKVTVDDAANDVGSSADIAVKTDGDPMISYYDNTADDLKFAICDLATGCDATGDWTKGVTVDATGDVGQSTSIALKADGDPMISYGDYTNRDLKFAICADLGTTGCDAPGEWTKVTVDDTAAGGMSSIAADNTAEPLISYYDDTTLDLKFANGVPPSVGGIAELADISGSSGDNNALLAGLVAAGMAGVLAITGGAWYARRRFS